MTFIEEEKYSSVFGKYSNESDSAEDVDSDELDDVHDFSQKVKQSKVDKIPQRMMKSERPDLLKKMISVKVPEKLMLGKRIAPQPVPKKV